MAVAPYGTEAGLWFSILLVFPALFAVPILILSFVGIFLRRFRRDSVVAASCSGAYLVGFILAVQMGHKIRMSAFHQLARRSDPLVSAVRSFERKYGHPPATLQGLVPEFLPAVPTTGMAAYPDYRYISPATNFDGNPWVIVVFTPSGGINFDQFMYFPLTKYPRSGYGGWLERVGEWAYVHE